MSWDLPETCKVCGMKMRNCGIFQNAIWVCDRCESKYDSVAERTDGETTQPMVEFGWSDVTPIPRASDQTALAAPGTSASSQLRHRLRPDALSLTTTGLPSPPPVLAPDDLDEHTHQQPESALRNTLSTPSRQALPNGRCSYHWEYAPGSCNCTLE